MQKDTTGPREQEGGPIPARAQRHAAPASGATVSIPCRVVTPISATTLRARLALLRPQPLRLRPAERSDR